jgi:signal transduction histidine kinase
VTAAFVAAAGALLASAPPLPAPHLVTGVLVVAYALAARIEFPIGAAMFAPTQLLLVPLFAVAPAQLVPLLVFAAYLLAAIAAAAMGRGNLDRVAFSAGDATHALGPAVVLSIFADGDATHAAPAVLVAAIGAQFAADLASSSVHEILTMGARAAVHARLLVQVWTADVALGAIGLLAASVAVNEPWAALAPAALVLPLYTIATERLRDAETAHDRLAELEREQARRAAAARSLERHDQLLQDVSHELRTPVVIARGHLELLRGKRGSSAESEVALEELERIERIVERLLVLARAEHPGALVRQSVDVESFLEDRFVRWSDAVPRPWRLGKLPAGRIMVDPDAISAALDALIENAVKHTSPSGAITVTARIDGRDALVIEVTDEGSGIPPDALEHVFERFACAEPILGPHGNGLGLAIVDAVARAHGGACTVESSPAGSTFALRLPDFTASRSAASRTPGPSGA